MSKWKMVRLGDVCEIVAGSTPSTSKQEYWDGSFYWVTPAEISDGDYYIERTQRKLTEAGISSAGLRLMPVGTVLLSSRAPIGKVAITAVEMACNQGFKNFVCGEKIHNRFLYYFLKNNKHYLNSLGRGATFKEISKSIVCEVEIPLPPLEEQKRIADILDKASKLIDLRKQQLEKMDFLIKSKFIDMFGDPVTNPKRFIVTTIENACILKSGTSLPMDVENEGGEIPYIKVSDMNLPGNEKFVMTSSRFVSVETAGNGIFRVGTVIFPKRGGAIGTNKKRLTVSKICADLNIMGVTPRKGILSEYLLAYFETIDLGSLNNGSSVPQINNKDINPLLINLPPIELQNQFAEFVEQVEKQKTVMQQSLEKMETNYKALMQEYFG